MPDEPAHPTVPLPPQELRMGGRHFVSDEDFVATAAADVRRLQEHAGLRAGSRLLDWGCGAGRLAVGVKHVLDGTVDYTGVDVQPSLLEWAQEHLADERTRFVLAPAANARYNPDGAPAYAIPGADGSVDVLYAYSVLSHMVVDELAAYAREITRLLAPGGTAMVTAFVEDDVPSWQENPEGYGPLAWEGRLHCVRYDRGFFEVVVTDGGLQVAGFEHGGETDGQSLYWLRRAG